MWVLRTFSAGSFDHPFVSSRGKELFFFYGRREGFDHVMFMGELTLLYGVVGVGEGPR